MKVPKARNARKAVAAKVKLPALDKAIVHFNLTNIVYNDKCQKQKINQRSKKCCLLIITCLAIVRFPLK